ncbi:MAG TPA: DUF420 domain-containing protein [Chitinophagaceae bacterium]|nr:DUF420 domain-containing protein [Chitinophagaceae bacterium]
METRGSFAIPITIISITIPLTVAALFLLPHATLGNAHPLKVLPFINAVLNSATAILLLASLYFILHGKWKVHRACNLIAVGLSVLFLLNYVIYHSFAPETHFGGKGWIRPLYFFILISHICLSVVIVPLVLVTLVRALKGDFVRHKKIARITWPLWFYVAITGVTVYVMLAPYY